MKNPKNHNIHAKVASLGFCCVRGYLLECAIQEKTPTEAMHALGLNRITFYHHAEKVKNGTHICQKKKQCLFPEPPPKQPPSGG